MARHEFRLPDLGDDAGNEAIVSFWYTEVGEGVEKDQGVLEMRTDKATFDVPAPISGTLAEIRVHDDDKVKVGDILGIIETAS